MKKQITHLALALLIGVFAFSAPALAQGDQSGSSQEGNDTQYTELNRAIGKAYARHRTIRKQRKAKQDRNERLDIDKLQWRYFFDRID